MIGSMILRHLPASSPPPRGSRLTADAGSRREKQWKGGKVKVCLNVNLDDSEAVWSIPNTATQVTLTSGVLESSDVERDVAANDAIDEDVDPERPLV